MSAVFLHRRNDTLHLDPDAIDRFLPAWLSLQIVGGQIGLPLLLLTCLFSRRVKRHAILINMFVTWTISTLCHCLLFYAGHQTGPEPPFGLCVTQAALVYGSRPMTALSTFFVIYHVRHTLLIAFGKKAETARPTLWLTISILTPYLLFIAFSIATVIPGLQHPSRVTRARSFFYCTVDYPKVKTAMSATAAACLVLSMIVEVLILKLVYSNWFSMKHLRAQEMDLRVVIRVGVYSLYTMLAFAVCMDVFFGRRSLIPPMFLATVPIAAFLVFGLQADVLNVWLRRHPSPNTQEDDVNPILTPSSCSPVVLITTDVMVITHGEEVESVIQSKAESSKV